eukprot:tig00000553_g2084.t1
MARLAPNSLPGARQPAPQQGSSSGHGPGGYGSSSSHGSGGYGGAHGAPKSENYGMLRAAAAAAPTGVPRYPQSASVRELLCIRAPRALRCLRLASSPRRMQ